MDTAAINAKKEEIQSQLTRWAEENDVLGPREQLVFNLRVVIVDKVDEGERDLHSLSLEAFFTKKYLIKAGVPIRYKLLMLESLATKLSKINPAVKTVGELANLGRGGLMHVCNTQRVNILGSRGIGNATLDTIGQLLGHYEVSFAWSST